MFEACPIRDRDRPAHGFAGVDPMRDEQRPRSHQIMNVADELLEMKACTGNDRRVCSIFEVSQSLRVSPLWFSTRRLSRASLPSVGIQPVVRQESIDRPFPSYRISFLHRVVGFNKSKRDVSTLSCGVFAKYHQQILPLLFHRNDCFRSAKLSK